MKTPATYNEFVRWFNVRKFGDLYNLDTKDRDRIYNHTSRWAAAAPWRATWKRSF